MLVTIYRFYSLTIFLLKMTGLAVVKLNLKKQKFFFKNYIAFLKFERNISAQVQSGTRLKKFLSSVQFSFLLFLLRHMNKITKC